LNELGVLEHFFDELRPLQVELPDQTDELHVVDQDLIECRGVVAFGFRSLNGILNKEGDDQGNEGKDAHQSQDIPRGIRALSTFEI
jgi:hypothetical protein